jgi:hypothetical protein
MIAWRGTMKVRYDCTKLTPFALAAAIGVYLVVNGASSLLAQTTYSTPQAAKVTKDPAVAVSIAACKRVAMSSRNDTALSDDRRLGGVFDLCMRNKGYLAKPECPDSVDLSLCFKRENQ